MMMTRLVRHLLSASLLVAMPSIYWFVPSLLEWLNLF